MQLTKNLAALALVASLGGLLAGHATAGAIYSFQGVTNTNWVDVDTGRAQLSLDVSNAGGGSVAFKFMNSGPNASSITAVYFDDRRGLLGSASVVNGPGVRFSPGATPPNLPGGKNIGFDTSFATDSDAPVPANGVNPGESLTVVFTLGKGTYEDILQALHGGIDLRTGIKLQALSGGGSESFVNNPEPASVLLLGLGLIGLALTRRRFASTAARRVRPRTG